MLFIWTDKLSRSPLYPCQLPSICSYRNAMVLILEQYFLFYFIVLFLNRWFGNTRVVTQQALQTFQEEMGKVKADPYRVVMKRSKLPVSLLQEKAKHVRSHLLETERFDHTFGPHSRRKRPSLKFGDVAEMAASVEEREENYASEDDRDLHRDVSGERPEAQEFIFQKGQSKRIWGELYKVVDASDVVVQVRFTCVVKIICQVFLLVCSP